MLKSFKKSFVFSLLIISSLIAATESLVMLLIGKLPDWGILLTANQTTLLDTALLSLISAPLIWVLSLRPLAEQVTNEQESSERHLQENTQLLAALDCHALVSITDLQGHIVYANSRFCEVSGYSREELLGQDHRIVNSGSHNKEYMHDMWRTIAQGRPWQGEFCNRNKQGGFYWVDTTIVPMQGYDGKPKRYISIRREISKLKENENRLELLKQALDASNEMILISNEKGLIKYVNPALCKASRYSQEQLLGQTATILDSPEMETQILSDMQQHLMLHKAWSGRLLNRRRGTAPFTIAGQTPPPEHRDYWVDVNITAMHDDTGALIGYVQVQHDITEQVNKEYAQQIEIADTAARLAISEALQQPITFEQRIRQVLEILFNLKAFDLQRKGGLFLKDPEQDFLDLVVLHGQFSDEFIRREQRIPYGACLCGRAAISQELILSDDCFCDPRHEHVFENMKSHGHYIVPVLSAGDTLGILFLYTDPYPVQLESRLNMLSQVGDMIALAVMQEQAKRTLEDARDAAEKATRVKSEFLANMSHEIRTPMNGVLGMLDILKDTELNSEQRDLVETANSSAAALLIIVNDILDYSKLEAGKIELESIEFNLPGLVEEVCVLMSSRAHEKGLELNCFLPPDLPAYWLGDPNRIRQVLTNLIGNAVKFTDQGEISVTASLHNKPDNHLLRFEVKDSGIGLSEENRLRLFQPFVQADSSTARRFGGTGLGLSISKKLIEIMSGDIGVDSQPGQGSCFWFDLPLQPCPDRVNQSFAPDALKHKRALIVDDNATNRKILRHYLAHWGIQTEEANNAASALSALKTAALQNRQVDIVLTDLQMPEMDGCALINAIDQDAGIAGIPRLLLSSGGLFPEDAKQKTNLTQILLKPVRQAVLFDALCYALQAKAPQAKSVSAASEPALPDFSSKRILVVEDNKVNQRVIISLLDKFRCKPDLAENGQEALDCLSEKNYDLLLMDCQMPVMDGYQATRLIRERETSQNLPHTAVIALTAHASTLEREKCLAAGMDDFISKPVARAELNRILCRWLTSSEADKTPANDQPPPTAKPIAGIPDEIWDKTAALERLDDDAELLYTLIDILLEDLPANLKKLQQAQAENDLTTLANIAHTIKGMGANLSATQLSALATVLEQQARQTKSADIPDLTQALATAGDRLINAFKQWQQSKPE